MPESTGGWLPPARIGHLSVTALTIASSPPPPGRIACRLERLHALRQGSGPGRAANSPNPRDQASCAQSAVAALKRGEVSLIAHVPPDQAAALAAFPEIKVGRYSLPVVHVLALDGRNPALRSRALRRGLSYAVDRKGLLEDNVLKSPATDPNAVADGPFPKGSYADAPGVRPLGISTLAGTNAGGCRS